MPWKILVYYELILWQGFCQFLSPEMYGVLGYVSICHIHCKISGEDGLSRGLEYWRWCEHIAKFCYFTDICGFDDVMRFCGRRRKKVFVMRKQRSASSEPKNPRSTRLDIASIALQLKSTEDMTPQRKNRRMFNDQQSCTGAYSAD